MLTSYYDRTQWKGLLFTVTYNLIYIRGAHTCAKVQFPSLGDMKVLVTVRGILKI